MIDFPKELNAEQLAVIEGGDGPCLVLAGAGSGKTRTITYRVAYLLEKGILPEEILLVTFTNKAAREMTSRVEMLTGLNKRLPWSGTFHHIGFRLLKQYAPLLGYQPNFTILDSEDSLDLLKLCLKYEGIERKDKHFPSPQVLHGLISYARNAETTLDAIITDKHPQWISIADTLTRVAGEYEKRKRAANAMDFDDLLVNTYLLLLKNDRVRERFATQFKYVLVDEYQDTNKIQASIVRLFSSYHHNLLVVGDDAQSIYSFRAADIANILDFERIFPEARIFRLETNYRSTPNILSLANEVIANNTRQHKKTLKSILPEFTRPEVHAFTDPREEAEFVVTRIKELQGEGVPLNEMAILFRAAFHSQAIEIELTKQGIPYDYRGGTRFFERAHIKDVLAYLRVIHNVHDTIAWSRVLAMQSGIGPAAIQKILFEFERLPEAASFQDIRHLGASLTARAQLGWNDVLKAWEAVEATKTEQGAILPGDAIVAILESVYRTYAEHEFPDARERLQDIEQLASYAEAAERRSGDAQEKALEQFLADASLQESYTAAGARQVQDAEEKLILSTIHQAKGLEWEAVFVVHLAAGQFPSDRSLRTDSGLEEERRLFYVAVTRAKKHLSMSYPLLGGFDTTLQGPSLFLEELSPDSYEEYGVRQSAPLTAFKDLSDESEGITYESEDEPFSSTNKRKKRPTSFLSSIEDLLS